MLEQYLSVFFSFVANVTVKFEDYDIDILEGDITPALALSFEKINADKTLFLRLVEKVNGLPMDFVEQFDISMVATVGIDKKIRVRHLSRLPLEADAAALKKEIIKFAPDRQAQKSVFCENNLFVIPEDTAGPSCCTHCRHS